MMTASEQNGTDKTVIEIQAKINSGDTGRSTVISHDPARCPKTPSATINCYYLFSVFYPDNTA